MKRGIVIITSILFALFLGGCGAAYQKAITHYNQGEYQSAIEDFTTVVNEGGLPPNVTTGDLYYQVGESYRLSNRVDEALTYYQQALDAGYSNDSLLVMMAYAYKANGNYKEASKLFNQYAKVGSSYEARELAKSEVNNTALIDSLSEPNKFITISNCDSLNTEAAEYSPALWNGDLVFTSSRGDGKIYEGTGTPFTDLFVAKLEEDTPCVGAAKSFNPAFNTPYLHEASATFSADGKTMVFARSNEGKKKDEFIEVDLFVSTYNGKQWSTPKMLSLSKDDSWDSNPALSPDGEILYFASNRSGSQGGTDIFKAVRTSSGDYKGVTPLGKPINTLGNEMFPTVTPDGKLYFASNGHPGLGGLDLFVVEDMDSVVVKNLGAPLNSIKDDFGLVMLGETNKGFFTSNRDSEEAKGDDDIYFFEDNSPTLDDAKYLLAGKTFKINYEDQTEILPQTKVVLTNQQGEILEEKISDNEGKFKFDTLLTLGEQYEVNAEKPAHFPDSSSVETEGKGLTEEDIAQGIFEKTFETTLTLRQDLFDGQLESGSEEEVVLENIFYDLDKANIRPDAAKELNKLVRYMKDRPELKIELGSHTDIRGGDDYNMNLSQRRAESAVQYLVDNGINSSRVTAKGYGETDLAVKNAKTEEEHQKNRRTTIKVIN